MNAKTIVCRVIIIIILCTCGFLLHNYSYIFNYFIPRDYSAAKIFSSSIINNKLIKEALYQVKDLEFGISIVDLGLVRNIEIKEDNSVEVTIVFTTPLCPYVDFMIAAIKKNIRKIKNIKKVEVNIDSKEMWQPAMMTDKGKAEFERLMR